MYSPVRMHSNPFAFNNFRFHFILLNGIILLHISNTTATGIENERQQQQQQQQRQPNDDDQQLLPICRVCACNRRLRTVECLAGSTPARNAAANASGAANGQQQFRLWKIRLPAWAESLHCLNLSQPEFPHFAGHRGVRELRIVHSQLRWLLPHSFAPLPALELLQLSDNNIEVLPDGLLQPLGNLRVLNLAGNQLTFAANENSSDDKDDGQQRHVLDRLILDRNPLCQNAPATSAATNGSVPKWTAFPLARQLHLQQTGLIGINGTHLTFQMNSSLCHLMFGEQNWRALEELRVGGNPQLHVYLDAMPLLAQLRLLDLSGAVDVPAALFTQWANQQTTKWRHLDLHGARITNLPSNGTADNDANSEQRWREIGVQMGQVQQICSSDLQWLDVSQLHLLGELSVSKCHELKWLYADENQLSGLHFADSTAPHALLALSMRSNRLRHLPDAVLAVAHSLVSLQLANNTIGRLPGNGHLMLLEQFPHLQQLDLAHNRLQHFRLQSASTVTAAANQTTPFSSLLHPSASTPLPMQSAVGELAFLNLSNNRLHTFHIAGAGVVLPSLAVLDLSGNLLDEFAALDQLPSLEHLHLARNPRIHLIAPSRAHSALVQLDIANCSLRHMPDLSRLVALRELNVRGNRLHTIPAHWLPSEGITSLDLRGNLFERVGWDWSARQLAAVMELHVEANPLDCVCAMPAQIAKRVGMRQPPRHSCTDEDSLLLYGLPSSSSSSAEFADWSHPLNAFLLPGDAIAEKHATAAAAARPPPSYPAIQSDCSSAAATADGMSAQQQLVGIVDQSATATTTSLFALFSLPVLLIGTSVAIAMLLLRNSNTGWKWQEQFNWAQSELGGRSTMLAYEQLPVEQMADSV